MTVLMISGSSRKESSNIQLLQAISREFGKYPFTFFDISALPLFSDNDRPVSKEVMQWKTALIECDAVLISTPEYIHNIPAALKNAFEWVTQSGEFTNKRVLPITYTPAPPRGSKAMQSLLWSLQAVEAQIVGQLDMYQTELKIKDGKLETDGDTYHLLIGSIELLIK